MSEQRDIDERRMLCFKQELFVLMKKWDAFFVEGDPYYGNDAEWGIGTVRSRVDE